jgi:hypothetical protein
MLDFINTRLMKKYPACGSALIFVQLLLSVVSIQGCGDSSEKPTGRTKSANSRKVNADAPEDQFRRLRMSQLDPRMKIGQIIMTVKRVNGSEVTYGGFYTLSFDEKLGIVGNKPDTFFFHALYRDGSIVGWNPDSNH